MARRCPVRDVMFIRKDVYLDGGAVRCSIEVTMIMRITQDEIERASKAIINVRTISKGAKRHLLIQAIQTGEDIVKVLDMWRKYCAYNARLERPADVYTTFKHDRATHAQVEQVWSILVVLVNYCSLKRQRSYADEIRQVDLLLEDVMQWIEDLLPEKINHAPF